MSDSAPTRPTKYFWEGQLRLLEDLTDGLELAVVSGNGYGKSHFGAEWHYDRMCLNESSPFSLITANKEDVLKKGPVQRFYDVLQFHGLSDKKKAFNDFKIVGKPPDIVFKWGHTVMCRSVHSSTVGSLVGVDVSHSWMDEPGLCPQQASTEVAKRTRCPKAACCQRLYTGTPEGVGWFSEKFGDLTPEGIREIEGYKIPLHSTGDKKLVLHGTTYENRVLRREYVESLIREFAWNKNLFLAYILGQFVPIYDFRGYDFDRSKHGSELLPIFEDRPLYLTWDFNVTQGRVGGVAWVTMQEQRQDLFVNAENKGASRTTLEAVAGFIKQFPVHTWGHREIIVTGDCNGDSRDTRGYGTDYDIIRQELAKAGYRNVKMQYPTSNPSVSLRVACVNRLFSDTYEAALRVSTVCNRLQNSLMQTTIDDKGQIKKPPGQTHTDFADACGYGAVKLRPIRDRWSPSKHDLVMS